MSSAWAEVASRLGYTLENCRRAMRSSPVQIEDSQIERMIHEHQSREACIKAALEGATMVLADRWLANAPNLFVDEKRIRQYAANIVGYGLGMDTWFARSHCSPMPVVLFTTRDCLDVIQPLGFYLATPPYTAIASLLARIHELVKAPMSKIRINTDDDLYQQVKSNSFGIPVEVSIYSVIRDTCIAIGDHPAVVPVVTQLVHSAIGSVDWQAAMLGSKAAYLQPSLTGRIIDVLEKGSCRGLWGPRWLLGTVMLSRRQVEMAAYHDRITIELRKGAAPSATAMILRAIWLNHRDIELIKLSKAYDLWRSRSSHLTCNCNCERGWCEHHMARYLARMGVTPNRLPLTRIPDSVIIPGSEPVVLYELYQGRGHIVREVADDAERLSSSLRQVTIDSSTPPGQANRQEPAENAISEPGNPSPPVPTRTSTHAPTDLAETLLTIHERRSGLFLSQSEAARFLLWGLPPLVDHLVHDLTRPSQSCEDGLVDAVIDIIHGQRRENERDPMHTLDQSCLATLLSGIGLASDRYRSLFAIPVNVCFECRSCLHIVDEPETIPHLNHPLEDGLVETMAMDLVCSEDECQGTIDVQRMLKTPLPPIIAINGRFTDDQVSEYVSKGLLLGTFPDGLTIWQVSSIYYQDEADQAITTRRIDAEDCWIYSYEMHSKDLVIHEGFTARALYFLDGQPTVCPIGVPEDVQAVSIVKLGWLYDRSKAFMHPALWDKLAKGWRDELVTLLQDLHGLLLLLRLDPVPLPSRCIDPSVDQHPGRADVDTLADCSWSDRFARPYHQFEVVLAGKLVAPIDWSDGVLGQELRGRAFWSYEVMSHVVAIMANKTRRPDTLVLHIALVNLLSDKGPRGKKLSTLSNESLEKHTRSRKRELAKFGIDLWQDRIIGFGLIDQHYFALVVFPKVARVHLIDSLITSKARLNSIHKLISDLFNSVRPVGEPEVVWTVESSPDSCKQGETVLCGLMTAYSIDLLTSGETAPALPLTWGSMGFDGPVVSKEEAQRAQGDVVGMIRAEWDFLVGIIDGVMSQNHTYSMQSRD